MPLPDVSIWFSLKGQNSQQIDTLKQGTDGAELSQASNVIPDPVGAFVTTPGFSKVRSTAIANGPAITGMFHMEDLADEFLLGNSLTGRLARDNANPPADIATGTAFTTGANVLLRGDFHENLLIVCSNARDLPQTVSASAVVADLGGTPPRGIDFKVFGRRGLMFSPSHGGTVYRSLASFNSANDDHDAWTTPVTINFLNFGKYEGEASVQGGEYFQDHLMAFTERAVYPIYQTPNADLPLAFQQAVFSEKGGGPPNIHAVVAANDRLYWISRNFDVKMMLGDRSVKSVGYPIQPFLRGLNDSRRVYTIGGFEPQYRIVWWAVSDGSDTTNLDCVGIHVDTNQFYFRTISRNAFCNRKVSGELRLIGGGYSGFFYNEWDASTTGDLDNAASAIDADVMSARHHLGLPGLRKRVLFLAVEFDPIGSEAVTIQYQLDDEQSWSSFAASPLTLSGTDSVVKYFGIPKAFKKIRVRFRDANSGERYRVLRYGFPKPSYVYTTRG